MIIKKLINLIKKKKKEKKMKQYQSNWFQVSEDTFEILNPLASPFDFSKIGVINISNICSPSEVFFLLFDSTIIDSIIEDINCILLDTIDTSQSSKCFPITKIVNLMI